MSIINSHLFLKYKGVPNPLDFKKQSKSYLYKLKKYAYWSAVHITENSKKILLEVNASLTANNDYDINHYSELAGIFTRVQRWKVDKENLALEPIRLNTFERLDSLIRLGSSQPVLIDEFILNSGYDYKKMSIESRWDLFIAIQLIEFFHAETACNFLFDVIARVDKFQNYEDLLAYTEKIIKLLYSFLGFDQECDDGDYSGILKLLIEKLGLSYETVATERSDRVPVISYQSKVLVSFYEGSQVELVKFNFVKNDLMIKVNSANRFFNSENQLALPLKTDEFWYMQGQAILYQLSDIEVIQNYFDNLAKVLRTR